MMIVLFVSLLFVFCYNTICCQQLNETDEWPSKIDFSQADFSLRLFRRLAKTGRSTVVSPFSIAVALAMINAGASGKTQKQLNDVLAKGVSSDAFNIYIKKLLKQLSKPLGGFRLNIATKLFVQKDLDMLKDYTSELHKDYASNVNEVDFQKPALVSQEINKWANKQLDNTSGKLVEAEMFPDATQMVVISIASFDGTWKKPFNDFASHNQTFFQTKAKRKKVSVIAQTEYFPYYSDQTLSAIAIPYEGDKVVMYIFLPNERHGLSTLEKTFTAKKLFRIIRNMKRTHVDVILPKFRLEKKTDLQRALNRLGVIDGFGEEANFTGICSAPLSLSTLIHEAIIEVSESGTKGTTNVEEFKWKFIPISSSEPAEFIADHPFLFAILHDDTLLFIGHFRG